MTQSILQHSNQTTKTIHQFPKSSVIIKRKKYPKDILLSSTFVITRRKKNIRGFINPLYLLLQVEGQRGCIKKEEIAK
jgi:hypothetical protein